MEIKVDVRGETCPVPLVEARKAIRRAAAGDVIEVTGNHEASKAEIPMAVDALGLKIIGIKEEGTTWLIKIQK
ncbi:MAG TPA: sulfurtransferase TusA family protein [bacterium]|nr:sulfurtransferase TusA family protein [bacterium]